jgi:hypothetical protein
VIATAMTRPPLEALSRTPAATRVRRLDGQLLRPDQAAELLSVKTSWIYAVRTGNLPCVRVGRHI